MTSQPTFADHEYDCRKRSTRRDEFLAAMDTAVPWADLTALVEPFYFSNTTGRPARGAGTMLRMLLLQAWYGLSDEGTEEQILDSRAMRGFMRLDLSRESPPDATTLLRFRKLLEANGLMEGIFGAVNAMPGRKGCVMRGGSVIDATIIAAPGSTKNLAKARDPEMASTRKGGHWFFGCKAHIGVSAGNGYVHSLEVTAANESDVSQTGKLLREDDGVAYADAGYLGADRHAGRGGIEWRICQRPGTRMRHPDKAVRALHRVEETRKASVRGKVEHPFRVLKRVFGFNKVRFRGLKANRSWLFLLMGLVNLYFYSASLGGARAARA